MEREQASNALPQVPAHEADASCSGKAIAGESNSDARPLVADVYNLTVLVHRFQDGGTSARSANLPLASVEAASVRDAMSQLVRSAKKLIHEHVSCDNSIPWIDPPEEPSESESRFMVPLHL